MEIQILRRTMYSNKKLFVDKKELSAKVRLCDDMTIVKMRIPIKISNEYNGN